MVSSFKSINYHLQDRTRVNRTLNLGYVIRTMADNNGQFCERRVRVVVWFLY